MEDPRLDELLGAMPKERARPGFTQAVLERLERPAPSPRPFPARAWVAALAVALVALSSGALWHHAAQTRNAHRVQRARQALAELRAEQRQLEQALRRPREPVLYLGGDEDVDLVLDLAKVRLAGKAAPALYPRDRL